MATIDMIMEYYCRHKKCYKGSHIVTQFTVNKYNDVIFHLYIVIMF